MNRQGFLLGVQPESAVSRRARRQRLYESNDINAWNRCFRGSWAFLAAPLVVVVAVMGMSLAASGAAAQETGAGRYWDLGVGCYFGGLNGLSELDVARFDWLYLCFGNISADIETVDLLNRLLAINPDLKIVIRLWPIMGIGDHDLNRSQATFLHYLYRPEVKEKLLQAIHD